MANLTHWLRVHADQLDESNQLAESVLPALAGDRLLAIGVPQEHGGAGGDVRDAIEAIAKVAELSLTAAFVFWGQRCFIEFMLQSPNRALAERRLPALLAGTQASAPSASRPSPSRAAWVTNLRKAGFVAAAAIAPNDGTPPVIVAFDSQLAGVRRNDDLDLIALRGSNTASVKLTQVRITTNDIISAACARLARARPIDMPHCMPRKAGRTCASLAQAALI